MKLFKNYDEQRLTNNEKNELSMLLEKFKSLHEKCSSLSISDRGLKNLNLCLTEIIEKNSTPLVSFFSFTKERKEMRPTDFSDFIIDKDYDGLYNESTRSIMESYPQYYDKHRTAPFISRFNQNNKKRGKKDIELMLTSHTTSNAVRYSKAYEEHLPSGFLKKSIPIHIRNQYKGREQIIQFLDIINVSLASRLFVSCLIGQTPEAKSICKFLTHLYKVRTTLSNSNYPNNTSQKPIASTNVIKKNQTNILDNHLAQDRDNVRQEVPLLLCGLYDAIKEHWKNKFEQSKYVKIIVDLWEYLTDNHFDLLAIDMDICYMAWENKSVQQEKIPNSPTNSQIEEYLKESYVGSWLNKNTNLSKDEISVFYNTLLDLLPKIHNTSRTANSSIDFNHIVLKSRVGPIIEKVVLEQEYSNWEDMISPDIEDSENSEIIGEVISKCHLPQTTYSQAEIKTLASEMYDPKNLNSEPFLGLGSKLGHL